jgi:hypothetical protein
MLRATIAEVLIARAKRQILVDRLREADSLSKARPFAVLSAQDAARERAKTQVEYNRRLREGDYSMPNAAGAILRAAFCPHMRSYSVSCARCNRVV